MLEPVFSPFPGLITERLILRSIERTDAPEILFLRSDDAVMQFIDREKTKSLEEAEAFINKIKTAAETNEGIMWAIALIDQPNVLIGTIGFWRLIKQHYRAEVGYMLHPDHWNKAIMKEALQAVIKYGFETMKLHSIEAHINPRNVASGVLLEKCGFTREAYFKEDYYFRGEFIDSAVYSLLEKSK
ncbi:MAG TPA: GNAT family N-acetyltransferase [Ferruginibacter sp.]|nr:GNAT family N-acetyltransferase [Ferruginibacter sp.]